MNDKITRIAEQLVRGAKKYKRPYYGLKITDERTSAQTRYRATDSEMVEAYFAAVNMLKAEGVPESNRPGIGLTKQQRSAMRQAGKEFASYVERILQCDATVSRSPIKKYKDSIVLSIDVTHEHFTSYVFFSLKDTEVWATFDEFGKLSLATHYCKQRFPRKFNESIFSTEITEAGF